jgi:hypothetical protein
MGRAMSHAYWNAGQFVPGGIKPTDHWHRKTNDGTCSRCRALVPEDEVPLMMWSPDGQDMLIFCESCLGIGRGE